MLDLFNENDVQIVTPAYVLDPSGAKIVPNESDAGRPPGLGR